VSAIDIATGFDYLTKVVAVGGGILGFIAYRNSREMKALELRVQLRTRHHDFAQLVDHIRPLMASALQSRRNVNAAIGLSRNGQETAFLDEHADALDEWALLADEKSKPAPNYRKLNFGELEARLVDLHALLLRAESLKSKYKATLAADDKMREQIHDDKMDEMARRMVEKP
jgi:hypothetical protein